MNSIMDILEVVTLLMICVSFSSSSEIPHECVKDADCGISFHCNLSFCEPCVPCREILNRFDPVSSSGELLCARTEDECGQCLQGYKSEDLANHRRSMKCYPTEVQSTSPGFTWVGLVWIGSLVLLIVVLLVIYFKCYYSRSTTGDNKEEEDVELQLIPNAPPPPYTMIDQAATLDETDRSTVTAVRESERLVVRVEEEYSNRAEPINYHRDNLNQEPESDEMNDQLQPVEGDEIADQESIGSNETIPSLWEPTPSIANSSLNIVRSLSLEMIPQRDNKVVRMPSDPGLLSRRRSSSGGENYCHRHVRLSLYRSESQNINSTASSPSVNQPPLTDDLKPSLNDQSDVDFEPEAPEPFLIQSSNGVENPESPTIQQTNSFQSRGTPRNFLLPFPGHPSGQSTPDSGFHQDHSRRRPGTTEDLYEVRLALSVKRRRRNCSENE